MMTQISTNFGSGNGMLPDSTKPFPEPMLIISEVLSHSPVGSLQEMSHFSILDMNLKITSLRPQWHLPGANELMITLNGDQAISV